MSRFNKSTSYFSFILLSRVLLGIIFIVSGMEKLTHPVEEFKVVLRGYHLLPEVLIQPMAAYLPWLELISGTLLLIGLFYPQSVLMVGLLLLIFTLAIGSTLVRGIPMEDCGCFKSLGIKENGPTALVRNIILLVFWVKLYFYKNEKWTVDQWLKKRE